MEINIILIINQILKIFPYKINSIILNLIKKNDHITNVIKKSFICFVIRY